MLLENVDLTKSLSKEEWGAQKHALQNRLYNLAQAAYHAKIPVCVILEGWDTSGKGDCIKTLTERQDPRGFVVQTITDPRTSEQQYPWLWRFWKSLPNYGQIGIYDTSWYRRVLIDRLHDKVSTVQVQQAYADIMDFERTLADDGMVFLKFFLHIGKDEQKRRLKRLASDKSPFNEVTEAEWEDHKNYHKLGAYAEETFERTNAEWAPWHIVPATDLRYAKMRVMDRVISKLETVFQDLGLKAEEVRQSGEIAEAANKRRTTPKPATRKSAATKAKASLPEAPEDGGADGAGGGDAEAKSEPRASKVAAGGAAAVKDKSKGGKSEGGKSKGAPKDKPAAKPKSDATPKADSKPRSDKKAKTDLKAGAKPKAKSKAKSKAKPGAKAKADAAKSANQK